MAVRFQSGVDPAEYRRRELALSDAFDAATGGEKVDDRQDADALVSDLDDFGLFRDAVVRLILG